jgi:hypothetical protein
MRGACAVQARSGRVHLHARCGDALARRIGPLGSLASELLPELSATPRGVRSRGQWRGLARLLRDLQPR